MSVKSRLLVVGDIHVKKNNLSEIRLFQEKLKECLKEFPPTQIILLGDNLDKHDTIFIPCLNHINSIIDMCRKVCPTYILVGNHDMTGPTEFLSDNHWLNAHKEWDNVVIVDRVVNTKIDEIPVTLIPYVENGRFIEALNTNPGWGSSQYIFAHQEFKGCKMGAIISEDGDEWPLNYPKVISGHIHSKQQSQDNVYYTGSALQHAFGDNGDNTLLFIEDGIMNEIDLQLPKKKTIYVDSSELSNLQITDTPDEIKVVVGGTLQEFKQFKKGKKYKELTNNNIKVVFKNTRKEVREEGELIKSFSNNENTNFINILHDLVLKENDDLLFNDFKKIVNI